jgi:hypothetical protein
MARERLEPMLSDAAIAPQPVPKGVRRLPKFDATVLSLYARALSVGEIHGHV